MHVAFLTYIAFLNYIDFLTSIDFLICIVFLAYIAHVAILFLEAIVSMFENEPLMWTGKIDFWQYKHQRLRAPSSKSFVSFNL